MTLEVSAFPFLTIFVLLAGVCILKPNSIIATALFVYAIVVIVSWFKKLRNKTTSKLKLKIFR